ncbi:MAG TPA: hypothetical protein VK726_27440 [Acetobacteraceae bacterium]|jgi:hypothetical protein|nr:hypothetical protein [Acetobacteraceae bacterium]
MAAQAYLVVRATVPDAADRPAFDQWYQLEHLPDAMKAFAAMTAWRAWSRTDPAVHCAFYAFVSVAAAEAITSSPAIRALIAEFDAKWGGKVTRTREILAVA